MFKKTGILLFVLCAGTLVPYAAQDDGTPRTPVSKDVRGDLQRMHALLGQMQKNAAFVSQGDTPLKHEFELEIEMWQIVLNDMEGKINQGESR